MNINSSTTMIVLSILTYMLHQVTSQRVPTEIQCNWNAPNPDVYRIETYKVNGVIRCFCIDIFNQVAEPPEIQATRHIWMTVDITNTLGYFYVNFFNDGCDISCQTCFTQSMASDCYSCTGGRLIKTFDSLMKLNQQGGSCSCPQGQFEYSPPQINCQFICYAPCKTCESGSGTLCTSCMINMQLSGSTCICSPGYYMVSGACNKCLVQCVTCTNGSSCASCGLNRTYPTCSCTAGYGEYPTKQQSCLPCISTCLRCSIYNKCTQCVTLQKRVLSGTNCVCPTQYYFDNGQLTCPPCHVSCLTCTNATTCSSCQADPNLTRLISPFTCICQPGWAKSPLETLCVRCDYRCQTCLQNNYEICTQCIPNTFRYLNNGSCSCLIGYFQSQGQATCQQCHYTCTSCFGAQSNQCTSCGDNAVTHRQLTNKMECKCDDHYGEMSASKNCDPCISRCDKCALYNECVSCISTQFRILNEIKCVCRSGYYEQNGEDICMPCHYTCNSCYDSGEFNCLTCDGNSGRELNILGACHCKEQFYDDDIITCAKCYYNCLTCDSGTSSTCLTCPATRSPVPTTPGHNSCPCATIKQIDDGESLYCTDCHYSCETCTGIQSNNCLTCLSRTLQMGSCACKVKHYDDGINENCQPCHGTCQTCQDNTNTGCITCSEIEFRVQYGQRCECIPHYFLQDVTFECVECNYRCDLCVEDQMHCTTCPANSQRSLNPVTNICECPSDFPNDVQGEPICQPCHYSCQNCTKPVENQCTLCEAAAHRTFANNYCPCDLHYFNNGITECEICSEYCGGCINTDKNCTSCDRLANRYLVGSQCHCIIKSTNEPLSYFQNENKAVICEACHYSCYTCNGSDKNQCLSCLSQDSRILVGTECLCISHTLDKGVGQCLNCNYKCDECVDSVFKCTKCPISALRLHDILAFTCNCDSGYFDDGTPLCKLCDKKCKTCTNTATTCLSCKSGMNRILTNFFCVCVEKYYDSNLEYCEPCHYSCQSCSGPTDSDCNYCSDFLLTHRVPKSRSCKCFDGYFDQIGNIECRKCSSNCETCVNEANNCLTCIGGQFREIINGICTCRQGYVDVGTDICLICDINCKTCNTQPKFCESCLNESYRVLNTLTKSCDCPSGYQDAGTPICLKCHYTCGTCQLEVSKCITCPTSSFRELTSLQQCLCISGTYEDGEINCVECDATCQTCVTKAFNCLTCDSRKNRIFQNNSCFCKDGYWEQLPSKVCQLCDPQCLTCFGAALNCMSCDATQGRQLMNNSCVCSTSKYYDSATQTCQDCAPQCYRCTGEANLCDICPVTRTKMGTNCECDAGYYDTGVQQCQFCSNKCETCRNTPTFCLSCRLDLFRYLSSNNCLCIAGYYEKGTRECGLCHYSCQECSGSYDNCTKCTTTTIVNRLPVANGKCLCKPGLYDDSQLNCKLCHYSCKTCITTATKCTSCEVNRTFRQDYSLLNNSCPCLTTFMDDGKLLCKKCAVQCINCVGQTDNCTLCNSNSGNYRVNITPACPCQTGYYADGTTLPCHKCHPRCGACNNLHANCTTCSGPNRLAAPSCGCKPSFYEDPVNKQCKECKFQCGTCDNPNTCITCRADRIGNSCSCPLGYYDAMVNLCQKCIMQCKECDIYSTNCTVCYGNRINVPKCICPDNYYDDNHSTDCQKCNYTCDKCNELGCVTCAGNRILRNNQCDCPIGAVPYTTTPYCSDCSVAVLVISFLKDSSGISILFDFPLLNQFADINLCLKIFTTETLKLLGIQPICQINTTNNKIITALFGEGASLMEEDEIVLIQDVLRHKDCAGQIKTYVISKILRPANLLVPEVQLKGPLFPVSPCNQIEIYITKQLNDGKRNFKNVTWSLLDFNDTIVRAIIEEANTLQLQQLTFPSTSLPENSNITINCAFTTFLNLTNSKNLTLMTINSKSPYLSFQSTMDSYFGWQPINVVLSYKNLMCSENQLILKNEAIDINIIENIQSRIPADAKPISLNQTAYKGLPDQDSITINIPAYTLTVGAQYSLLAETINYADNVKTTAYFNFKIQSSPLLAQIKDGTRVQAYYKGFTVEAQARDPETNFKWNEDKSITVFMECIDVSTQGYCRNQLGEILEVNKHSTIQHVKGKILTPYTVQKWQATFQKGDRKVVTSAMIVLLDEEIPQLSFSYPQGWQLRRVNVNEVLEIVIPLDPQSIYTEIEYSVGFIYDYNNVGIIYSKGNVLRFRIWDKFSNFTTIDKITLQVQAHDLKQFMPAVGTITLMVNTPPINCLFTVSPPDGNSIFTYFTLLVENARDSDQPLSYKYSYYSSLEDQNYDIQNGVQLRIIDFNNFQKSSNFKTILPSGTNSSIWIVAQISDSLGSVSNQTKQVNIPSLHQIMKQQNLTCQYIIDNVQIQLRVSLSFQLIVLEELVNLYNKTGIECKILVGKEIRRQKLQIMEIFLNSDQNQHNQQQISRILSLIESLGRLVKNNRLLSANDINICADQKEESNLLQMISIEKTPIQDNSDLTPDQVVKMLRQVKSLVETLMTEQLSYLNTIKLNKDVGSESTYRLLQINYNIRINLISIISDLSSNLEYQASDDQLQNITRECLTLIRYNLNQLTESFGVNFVINNPTLRIVASHIGINVRKLTQFELNKLLQSNKPSKGQTGYGERDIVLPITHHFLMKIVKYENDPYRMDEQIIATLANSSIVKQPDYENISSIIPLKQNVIIDPIIEQYYNNNLQFILPRVFEKKFALDLEIFIPYCINQTQKWIDETKSTYKLICGQYLNGSIIQKCKFVQINNNKTGYFTQCSCTELLPTSLFISKQQLIYNNTSETAVVGILENEQFMGGHYQDNWITYIVGGISLIMLLIMIWMNRIDKKQYIIVQQAVQPEAQVSLKALTREARIDTKFINANFKKIHEIFALFQIHNPQISRTYRAILLFQHIYILIALTNITNYYLPIYASILLSNVGSVIMQTLTKMMEGLFTIDIKIVRIIGSIISIAIMGACIYTIFVFDEYSFNLISLLFYKNISWVITFMVSFIIEFTIIEYIIVTVKIHGFKILELKLRQNKFDPETHFLYYFVQNYIVNKLVLESERQ